MRRTPMTEEDHRRVSEAIRIAESRTSGEIYCVLAHRSDSYFFPAAVSLLVSILLISVGAALVLDEMWLTVSLAWFASAQVLSAGCGLLVLWLFAPLRIFLVPHSLRQSRAHDNAWKQFLSRNVHRTARRTGVLIFLSLEERYAEVVADSGINAKVVSGTWQAVVDILIDGARSGRPAEGFVEAVEAVGELLAEHFPVGAGDENELDDHLVEI